MFGVTPDPKHIIARFTGGLGNQLFIYATAKALSLRTGRELILDTVDFKYDKRYKRQYELILSCSIMKRLIIEQ